MNKPTNPHKTRLNKHLVELGLVNSRRKADIAISEGIVEVNNKIAKMGELVSQTDHITLSGRTGKTQSHITIIFYKPTGYVCTHLENGRSKTIFDLLPKTFKSLKIAGRLDKNSQGLMLLSSSGELINTIAHPSSQKDKEYIVTLKSSFNTKDLARLLQGVELDDGLSLFTKAKIITPQKLRVILREGRKRQIRRTFSAIGYKVVELERTRIGSVSTGLLKSGEYRFLKENEIKDILK